NHCGGAPSTRSRSTTSICPPSPQRTTASTSRPTDGPAGRSSPSRRRRSRTISSTTLDEYHVDGLRFDEVTVIDSMGGWSCAQHMTDTLRYLKPSAVLIAEYWGQNRWLAT